MLLTQYWLSRSHTHQRQISRYFALPLLLVAFFSLSCTRTRPNPDKTQTREIDVAAASNLSAAFKDLGRQFEAETGIRVVLSFGATAELEKQIENGAPFDVFAAADVEHIEKLNSLGLLTAGTNRNYAQGRLILWIPSGSSLNIDRIEDITGTDVERIAISKPDLAPYGRATVEALRKMNIWDRIEPKVIYGQNVSQAKQYASTGNAEVAFIPLSLIQPNEGRFIEVDQRLHQPIVQAIAVVKESSKQEAAGSFVEYVLSPKGQELLERFGYKRP